MSFESIIGNSLLTFTLIPFFASLLTELGFNKKRIMFATIGSLFLGMFASTIGFGSLISYLLKLGKKNLLKERLIIFGITALVLVVSLILKNAKDVDLEKMDFTYEEKTKKSIGLLIILFISFIISIIGFYNFSEYLGINIFKNISESLSNIAILNGISKFGSWGTKDLAALLLFDSFIISIFYRIKFSELMDAFKIGAKSMFKVSIYATLSGLIFIYCYQSEVGYNWIDTVVNSIYNSSGEYLALKTALVSPLYNALFNNHLFLASNITAIIASISSNKASLALSGLAVQLMSGFWNLILPTSYILIAGLVYYNISYFSWLKYIWKILIVLFLIAGIIILA